ncbi:MAG: YARHG domain-containing protein [Eubacteriales bacterium]|nr:YARHG domain-containing protein [Eubacteriales bacterium]
MNRKNDILKIILIALTGIFLLITAATMLLSGQRKREQEEQQKQQALDTLERIPTVSPESSVTEAPTLSPVPSAVPTLTPTPTPTPMPTKEPAFQAEDYLGVWYSTDGLASLDIYELNENTVTFFFSQGNQDGSKVCEAEVTGEVAGNAAQFLFTDSWGNVASGSMTFDNGTLYVKISTIQRVEGVSVCPEVNCVMTREQPVSEPTAAPEPTPTPVPEISPSAEPTETPEPSGDYYFPDSDSRILTDEELAQYSSSDLELAKNEIYARHGRIFVTERISSYFNSKSWYQGTIDPEVFDEQQGSIFNEYEVANIGKIAAWEQKKRDEGN